MKKLTRKDRVFLLELARKTIESYFMTRSMVEISPSDLSEALLNDRAVFVTLSKQHRLRGCIGSLEAYQPLYKDVQERALHAAFEDHRFLPVDRNEMTEINIEISILSEPEELVYNSPLELPKCLRPGIDGVILQDGQRRATFLPQVWQQIPSPRDFLGQLCEKMGASASLWQTKMLKVMVYEVEQFSEERI